MPLEPGKTYEMLLDPGKGKYATIQTEKPHSAVYIDGDSIGESPVFNTYILYGTHRLMAKSDRMEGELTVTINPGDTETDLNLYVPMEDQSVHYGQVVIRTDPDAVILMDGQPKGTRGTYATELYEGDYVVETQKLNCDNSITRFTVKPQTTNVVEAAAPVPHVGRLSLYTRPHNALIEIDGVSVTRSDSYELPIGLHTVSLTCKDYYPLSREVTISHNEVLLDTLNMERVQYLKPEGFYLGGAATIGGFSGLTFLAGGIYNSIDLQLSFMLGLSKSGIANYYNKTTGTFMGRAQYRLNVLSAKVGCQIPLMTRFGITPQLGLAAHMLSGSTLTGSVPSEDTSAACITIGAKLIYSPMQNLCLFAAPELDIALSKGQQYQEIADVAGFSAGGFFCNIGIIVNF